MRKQVIKLIYFLLITFISLLQQFKMACYQGKERQFSQFFFAILITGQSVELIAQSHSGRDTGHDIEGIILIYRA